MNSDLTEIELFVRNEYENNEVVRFNELYCHDLTKPICNKTVLMEVRDGHSFVGNIKAIYEWMRQDKRFKQYHFYISYQHEDEKEEMKKYMTVDDRTHFVRRLSKEYAKALATCQYLFNNSTFISSFVKRKEQVYINTWHGTPLKHMGFDLENLTANKNVLRNFLMTDYLLSPNQHTTNIFLEKYKLNGLYEGMIIENGYPRIDATLHGDKNKVITDLKDQGLLFDENKQTVLYTPTWRGTNVSSPVVSLDILWQEVATLTQELADYNVLIKVHPFMYQQVKKDTRFSSYLVSDAYDINELFCVVDYLLTDYSSAFFDFLVTDKPIIFYCPDQRIYQKERGMYFTKEELPGPVFERLDGVITCIKTKGYTVKEAQYKKMKQAIVPYDHGTVTKQYINTIFFNKKRGIHLVKANGKKKKLLLYAGGMKNNGITTALINLCWALDQNQYDITIFMGDRFGKEVENNIKKLPPYVRQFYRVGFPLCTPKERYEDQIMMKLPTKENYHRYYSQLQLFYQRETQRLFGHCHFDYAIDYSGYSYYWAKYILNVKANKKYIYLHNDMVNEVNTREIHARNLLAIFLLYPQFDCLVNVSDELCQLNREKLSAIVEQEKHISVPNCLSLNHPLATEEETLVRLKSVHYRGTVSSDLDVTVFFDDCQEPMTLHKEDELYIDYEEWHHDYCLLHLHVNHLPVGWVEKRGIHVQELCDDFVQKIPLNQMAHIKTTKGRAFVYQDSDCFVNQYATGLHRLSGLSLVIKEKLVTRTGKTYYNAFYNEWSGCFSENQLVFESPLQSIDVEAKSLPTLSVSIKQWIEPNDTESKTYSCLYGLKNCKECGPISSYSQRYFYAYYKMKNAYGTFYQLMTLKGQQFWINAKDVSIVTDPFVVYRQNESFPHVISGQYIEGYANEKDLQNNQSICLVSLNEIGDVKEKWWTQKGIYYLVDSPSFTGLLPEQCVHGRYYKGKIKDIKQQWVRDFDQQHYHFITCGRLSPEKNHAALIAGFAHYFSCYPEQKEHVDCYILGEGPLADDLYNQIKANQLEDNIFLLGYKENPRVYLNKANHFIFPSQYEGQGLALIEAMMEGLPVSVNNIPVLNEVVQNGKHGALIHDMSKETIARHIQETIATKQIYEPFDAASYQSKVMDKIEKLLFNEPLKHERKRWLSVIKKYFTHFRKNTTS